MLSRAGGVALISVGLGFCLLNISCSSGMQESGWVVLFDGSGTDQWRAYQRDTFPDKGWIRDRDALKTVPGGDVVDILTRKQYGDFELELEWKVSPAGNSGVFVRVAEDAPEIWMEAPEIQILDDELHRDGQRGETSAGALYDLIAPRPKSLRPVGEFNKTRILMSGSHLEHWLNDIKVLEADLDSPQFRELVANSKFKDYESFGKAARGHVALQHHGEEVWFRNVRIRELAPE